MNIDCIMTIFFPLQTFKNCRIWNLGGNSFLLQTSPLYLSFVYEPAVTPLLQQHYMTIAMGKMNPTFAIRSKKPIKGAHNRLSNAYNKFTNPYPMQNKSLTQF